MSFEPPEGILDIGNATLRVGKLEVSETTGLNQGLQNIVKNDLLITETDSYTTSKSWGLKLPTTWVAEFDIQGQTGKYVEFNFYNEGSTSNAQGYTLNFKDTSLTLKYDNGSTLATATIPTIVGTFRKVNIFFERGVIAVSIDGARVLYHKESDGFNNGLGVASRVISTTGSAFLNAFIQSDHGGNSIFKNLRIVNGRFISDKTSNVSFIGSLGVGVNNPKESLDIRGNMHLTRVSNVSQIKVDSNVVTEYTGPHDRPLRKYPEVALTANSDRGYVASASTTYNNNGAVYPTFAGDGGSGTWLSQDGAFDTNDPYTALDTASLFDDQRGEWIQLQLPSAIKVSYFKIIPRSTAGGTNAAPEDQTKRGSLYGSNDGTNFTKLIDYGDLDYGGASGQNVQIIHVNATEHYKYLRLLCTARYGNFNNQQWVGVGELEYYGYEEGDASLDTTLKSVYNVPATTGTQLEVYYDAKDLTEMPGTVTDLSPNSNTGAVSGHSPTLDSTDGIDSFKFNGSSQYVTGTHGLTTGSDPVHTISLWFKRTAKVNQFDYLVQLGEGGTSHQQSAIFIDDDKIGHGHWGGGVYQTDVITDNVWYHVAATFTGGNTSDLSTHKIYVNGVEKGINAYSSDGPLVLTGTALTLGRNEDALGSPGGYFNGSIANFRLYSKALNADQVKELYDYQKDYFLGSKSQLTIYKGHLGVGVTEPSGQLELAGDERIQEYPPGPMDDYETLIPGHGVFCASASSYYGSYYPWNAFDKNITDDSTQQAVWHTEADFTNATPGIYNAGASLGEYTGAWLKLKLPYSIKPSKVSIHPRTYPGGTSDYDQNPKDFLILGSKDDNTWDVLSTQTDVVFGTTWKDFTLSPGNNTYNYFAISCTKIKHGQYFAINDMKYFGTPGPTTLDKGSLSLTRSLDVPRISRYDVDTETPRPEKLVLDLDTTVNSSPTDISGKGNHGTFEGAAEYSEADKAFTGFPSSSSNYIRGNLSGVSGAYAHTQSYWINGADTTPRCPFTVGKEAGNYSYLNIWLTTSKWVLNADGAASGEWAETIYDNRWYHVVLTYDGGSSTSSYKLYINGEYKTPTTAISITTSLALPSNPEYRIGRNDGTQWYNGMVSNPKVYNVALEPSEVRKLYNLGRTGRSMVISDTAVGIGKVPEAQLDVRGNISATGTIRSKRPMWSAGYQPGSNTTLPNMPSTVGIVFQNLNYDYTGNYSTSTGRFTAPVSGYYFVGTRALIYVSTGQTRIDVEIKKVTTNGTITRVIQGERLAGSQGGRATNLNMTVQISGTLYLVGGEQIYPAYLRSSSDAAYINTIGNDFNEFWGFLIEQV